VLRRCGLLGRGAPLGSFQRPSLSLSQFEVSDQMRARLRRMMRRVLRRCGLLGRGAKLESINAQRAPCFAFKLGFASFVSMLNHLNRAHTRQAW
jgi:hypothetical protein